MSGWCCVLSVTFCGLLAALLAGAVTGKLCPSAAVEPCMGPIGMGD